MLLTAAREPVMCLSFFLMQLTLTEHWLSPYTHLQLTLQCPVLSKCSVWSHHWFQHIGRNTTLTEQRTAGVFVLNNYKLRATREYVYYIIEYYNLSTPSCLFSCILIRTEISLVMTAMIVTDNICLFSTHKNQAWKMNKYFYSCTALKYDFQVFVLYLSIYILGDL